MRYGIAAVNRNHAIVRLKRTIVKVTKIGRSNQFASLINGLIKKMNKTLLLLMLIAGSLLSLTWYCAALIDWLDEYSSGYYAYHRLEQVLKTSALGAYTYGAVRFYRNRVDFLP